MISLFNAIDDSDLKQKQVLILTDDDIVKEDDLFNAYDLVVIPKYWAGQKNSYIEMVISKASPNVVVKYI